MLLPCQDKNPNLFGRQLPGLWRLASESAREACTGRTKANAKKTADQINATRLEVARAYPFDAAARTLHPVSKALRNGISRMILPGANQTEGNEDNEVSFQSNFNVNDCCHPERKAREPQIKMKEQERSNSKDVSLDSG